MMDKRLGRFASTTSILVGVALIVVIILGLLGMQRVIHGMFVVASLLAFGVVIGIGRSVMGGHPGWVLWGSSLGLFSFALSAIVQTSLLLGVDRQQLLPQSLLVFGTFAAWVVIMSVVALVTPYWAATWSWMGVALSLMSAGLIPAQQVGARAAAMVLGGGATVLAAIWFIWAGVTLSGEGEEGASIHQPGGDRSAG